MTDLRYLGSVKQIVGRFKESLQEIDRFSLEGVEDKQLLKSFNNIKNSIFQGLNRIERQVGAILSESEWDRLNISFFGETNSGKSTLIEAITRGDGRSIGDGRKDYTRKTKTYQLQCVNLLDMPGIEGNEAPVINEIRSAVNRSHIIFYVLGNDKEPEEGTIFKIKRFLKDNAKIYSIQNIRRFPSAYRRPSEKAEYNAQVIAHRTQEHFRKALGGNYITHIQVNAYLALLLSERLEERFKRDRVKALEILGGLTEIENKSNIREIINLIDTLAQNYPFEIKITNTYKLLGAFRSMLTQVLGGKKQLDCLIKGSLENADKYLKEIESTIAKYDHLVRTTTKLHINKLRSNLKRSIGNLIDNDAEKSIMKSEMEDIKNKLFKELHDGINKLLDDMKMEIEGKIQEFKDRMRLEVRAFSHSDTFQLEDILEALEISFKYICKQIVDIMLSVWGIVIAFGFNPIVGVIALILALARKIWEWFFTDPSKRKNEAKQKANKQIDDELDKIDRKVSSSMESEIASLRIKAQLPAKQFRTHMQCVKKISRMIDLKIEDLNRAYNSLCLVLAQEMLGENISFAYLDQYAAKGVVIGVEVDPTLKRNIESTLRLPNGLDFYSSPEQWIRNTGESLDDMIFYVEDEFSLRAIRSFAAEKPDWFTYRIIKRRNHDEPRFSRSKA